MDESKLKAKCSKCQNVIEYEGDYITKGLPCRCKGLVYEGV